MGVLPSSFSSHYVSSNSPAVLSAGRWNSENSGECWFLLCREGILILVFYTTNLSALRSYCIPCTISAFCSLAPQHLALSAPLPAHLNKHQFICCGETAERSHISQCISSSDALLQTQQSKDFCNLFLGTVPIYQQWLFLLLPQSLWAHRGHARHRARLAAYTAASDHNPLCLQQPAGAPASPQLQHKASSQDRAARVFQGNSFLHKPALRHSFFAAVQLRGRAHAEALEEQSFLSLPPGRCPPFTVPLQNGCHSCTSWDLCPPRAWPSFPSGTILPPLNCSSSRAGAQNIFPDRFSKEMSGEDSSPPALQCLRQTLTSTISLFIISHN